MGYAAGFSKLLVTVVALAVLTACGGSPTAASTPTSSPSPSATAPAATPASPTATTPATAAVPTATPSPTLVTGQDAVDAIVALGEADLYQFHPSPDGQWRVDVLNFPCRGVGATDSGERLRVEQLILADTSSGTQQVMGTQLLTCDGGLGASGFGGFVWSPDSRIFYYTDARDGVPDGGGGVCWDRPLWALYAESGTAERLATTWAHTGEWGRLAYLGDTELIVQTLSGEEIARIPLQDPETEVCEIAWSPEGTPDTAALVALQASDPFGPGPVSVACIDVLRHTYTLLLLVDDVAAPALTWETADEIVVSGYRNGERLTWTVAQPCSAVVAATVVGPVPDDIADWDTYALPDLGFTLPVPPGWKITESAGSPALRSTVAFQPPLWETPAECGYQCPTISLEVYTDVLEDGELSEAVLRAWLEDRATTAPFGTPVEGDDVIFFGVAEIGPTTLGDRPALAFGHGAMGIHIRTTITVVDGVVLGLTKTHVGQFDFEPVYEVMRAHAVFAASSGD